MHRLDRAGCVFPAPPRCGTSSPERRRLGRLRDPPAFGVAVGAARVAESRMSRPQEHSLAADALESFMPPPATGLAWPWTLIAKAHLCSEAVGPLRGELAPSTRRDARRGGSSGTSSRRHLGRLVGGRGEDTGTTRSPLADRPTCEPRVQVRVLSPALRRTAQVLQVAALTRDAGPGGRCPPSRSVHPRGHARLTRAPRRASTRAVSERRYTFSPGPPLALINSRDPEVLHAVRAGRALLTRLEGEWWMGHHLEPFSGAAAASEDPPRRGGGGRHPGASDACVDAARARGRPDRAADARRRDDRRDGGGEAGRPVLSRAYHVRNPEIAKWMER